LFLVLMLMAFSSVCSNAQTPGIVAASAGHANSLALLSDGSLWAWGSNFYGLIGNDSIIQVANPLPEKVPISNVSAISTSENNVAVLKEDGTVWIWGSCGYGELGDGSQGVKVFTSIPTKAYISNVKAISVGSYYIVALKDDGTVWVWGYNQDGRLGDGTKSDKLFPTRVTGLKNITDVKAYAFHALAIDDRGNVWTWGYNTTSVGPNSTNDIITPERVPISNVKAISAGAFHSLALKDDGTVWAWGNNDHGELGDGTITMSNIPVMVKGLSDVVAIDAATFYSVALKKDGTVWEWGKNDGRLGIGETSDLGAIYPNPQKVFIDHVKAISAGTSHTLALKDDGTLWSWGFNFNGQLGNGKVKGDGTGSLIPVKVLINENTRIPISITPTSNENNPSAGAPQSNGFGFNTTGLIGMLALIGCVIYQFIRKGK